jgi:hypothetical protein
MDPATAKANSLHDSAVASRGSTPDNQGTPNLVQPWRAFIKARLPEQETSVWAPGSSSTGNVRLRVEADDKHLGG